MKVADWFVEQGMDPAPFQRRVWQAYGAGLNGLLVAPTGSGKTYAVMGAIAEESLRSGEPSIPGVKVLWITPLRALAADIAASVAKLSEGVGLRWDVELRTGDTASSTKVRQRKRLPEILVTTPESLHVMLSYPRSTDLFKGLECIVVDEWHELLGSKRGVMMQLALSHLPSIAPRLRVWGISATLGNPNRAMEVLLSAQERGRRLVQDPRRKRLVIETVVPVDIERFPWAGHLGDRLLDRAVEIIRSSRSSLIFTNTRNQSEVWYRKLLAADETLAGRIALHHGSLSKDERAWVEAALHEGRLRAVVCTSSLDLGVDFRPVDTVIQVGSPKGVARLMQRAGRSGHSPGQQSRLYFIPTNALELVEAAALKRAVSQNAIEPVEPPTLSLDVLVQWLITLAVGDGLDPKAIQAEVGKTAAYSELSADVWDWVFRFITTGGPALTAYEHYRKLEADGDGRLRSSSRMITTRHRQAIGVITSSAGIRVQIIRGQVLGTVEESFAGTLQPGQTFWFSGRALEFVRLRELTIWVRASRMRAGTTPSWAGGRLPLSNQLAAELRAQLEQSMDGKSRAPELVALKPLLNIQQAWSAVPTAGQLLVEQFKNREGHHIAVYPFEGRGMHEVMAALMAARMGRDPNTFSFAYNDYGFELLSAKEVTLDVSTLQALLSTADLETDVMEAVAAGTMPQRQFRSIATIAGLVTSGRPGKPQATKHIQASSEMIYEVLREHDPDNLLLEQARREVLDRVIDLGRLHDTLKRIEAAQIVLTSPPRPTPLAFPLMVDRLRERLSTEQLADRIARMSAALERYADRV